MLPKTGDEISADFKTFAAWCLLAGAICLLFAPISIANWGTVIPILVSWWIIPKILSTLASGVNSPRRKLWCFILELFASTVLLFAPRIAVFVWEIPPQMLWYIIIVYPLALFEGMDNLAKSSNYALKGFDGGKILIPIFSICNLLPLPLLIRYGMCHWNFYDAAVNAFIQLIFTPFCLFATLSVGFVLTGNWGEVNDTEDRNPAAAPAPTVVQPTPARQRQPPRPIPKFHCDDCFSEYTDIKIPRVSKECGHTVCEQCADELLVENNQRHLQCPVCNKVTLVYGTGKMLPRNYVNLMAMGN